MMPSARLRCLSLLKPLGRAAVSSSSEKTMEIDLPEQEIDLYDATIFRLPARPGAAHYVLLAWHTGDGNTH
jgi:hypothetical protein